MKLAECKPGDAVRLPNGRNAIVSFAPSKISPSLMWVKESSGARRRSTDIEVIPLVPATEVEEAVRAERERLKPVLKWARRVITSGIETRRAMLARADNAEPGSPFKLTDKDRRIQQEYCDQLESLLALILEEPS